MKETGIVRRIDDLGRVVIPKAIRPGMGIEAGDPLELYTVGDCVILRKYREDQKPPLFEELQRLQAEIDARETELQQTIEMGKRNTLVMQDEIQRLQSAVEAAKIAMGHETSVLDVEIERLRAALEDIDADHSPTWESGTEAYYRLKDIATAALSHQTDQPASSLQADYDALQQKHKVVVKLLHEVSDVLIDGNARKAWLMIMDWVRDNAPGQTEHPDSERIDYKLRYESIVQALRDAFNELPPNGTAEDLIYWVESTTPFELEPESKGEDSNA